MPQIIPIRDLKNTSEISEMCHKSDEPIFVNKNGYGDMVIMSIETYEKMLYINDIYKKIEQGEKAISENRVINAKQSVDSLGASMDMKLLYLEETHNDIDSILYFNLSDR